MIPPEFTRPLVGFKPTTQLLSAGDTMLEIVCFPIRPLHRDQHNISALSERTSVPRLANTDPSPTEMAHPELLPNAFMFG